MTTRMAHQHVNRRLQLSQALLEEWIALGTERLWRLISGRSPALVLPGEVWVEGVHVTSARRMVPITVHVKFGKHDQHQFEVSTAPAPRRARPPAILPPDDRHTSRTTSGEMRFSTDPAEQDSDYVSRILHEAADTLLTAAADVASDRRVSLLVGIAFRVLDKNWPPGVLSIGSYRLAGITAPEDFEFPALTLTRIVSEFGWHMCEVRWSERLNRAATLIAILADVSFRLTDRPPPELRKKFGIPFHPFVEKPGAPLDAFVTGLSPIPTYDPTDPNQGGLSRLRAMPRDLVALFQAYESLAPPRHEVIDDALTALQVSIEVRDRLPSVTLMALWTAVERLCDMDRRWVDEGKKRERIARTNRAPASASQEAILAMAETLFSVKRGGLGELAKTLERVRNMRNDWAHDGRLGAKDLSTQAEIWVAHTTARTPNWAESGTLLGTMTQLTRRLVVAILSRELAQAGQIRPPGHGRGRRGAPAIATST